MIKPNSLKRGDKIAIISPAGKINPDFIKSAANYLAELGFDPIIGENCLGNHYNYSSTDEQRLSDFQTALDNNEIKAILCSRGGYGAIKIINQIDFSAFRKNPKWIIGFSDITTFHLALNNIGIMSIHGQMAKAFHDNPQSESVQNILAILNNNIPNHNIKSHKSNRIGSAEAELTGGNLSIIYSLQATKFEINTDGKILFIEDLGEYLYHLDRIMINLKLSGKLSKLKGLIVGSFTDMKDNENPFGKSAYEIIHEHVSEYNYPVCFNFPAGHIANNQALVFGRKYKMEVGEDFVSVN